MGKLFIKGDTVEYGRYNNGDEIKPITWKVIETTGNKALLITEYCIDSSFYHDECEDATWENSTLRKWLNKEFYNAAFSEEEKKMISVSDVTADANPDYNTPQGNTTQDKVFLLSINEVNKYFASDAKRQCVPTEYAVANGVYKDEDDGTCDWWLRSSGRDSDLAAGVAHDGSVDTSGLYIVFGIRAVRPALWINSESKISGAAYE